MGKDGLHLLTQYQERWTNLWGNGVVFLSVLWGMEHRMIDLERSMSKNLSGHCKYMPHKVHNWIHGVYHIEIHFIWSKVLHKVIVEEARCSCQAQSIWEISCTSIHLFVHFRCVGNVLIHSNNLCSFHGVLKSKHIHCTVTRLSSPKNNLHMNCPKR